MTLQEMIPYYDDKQIDLIKTGWTVLNLANIFLPNKTKLSPFCGSKKGLFEKNRKTELVDIRL